jgi:hypothetical protein
MLSSIGQTGRKSIAFGIVRNDRNRGDQHAGDRQVTNDGDAVELTGVPSLGAHPVANPGRGALTGGGGLTGDQEGSDRNSGKSFPHRFSPDGLTSNRAGAHWIPKRIESHSTSASLVTNNKLNNKALQEKNSNA